MNAEATTRVHEAIGELLDEGEIAIAWTLTIDVAGPDNVRYLAHRAGGGVDGSEKPQVCLRRPGGRPGASRAPSNQLRDCTVDDEDDDGDDDS